MPDIDIDFSVRGREQVIRYVTDKYGADQVAQIVTFGKMLPRAATRDAARVLGHDYGAGDRLAKLIPDPIMGRPPSFEDCLKPGEPLRAAYDAEPDAKQIVDVAQGLEGIVRNSSIHAAAVVIADRPLTDIVPLQLADAGAGDDGAKIYRTVTQYSMKPIEEIGLLKMDFLGLRNLDVIEDALDIIERSTGERPGHGDAAARRRADLRDARARRLGRRLPVRVRGHARGAEEGPADRVRRPRRARRALPPGRDGPDPDLRPRQARPEIVELPRRAPAPDHRADEGRDPLPGAGDADRQVDRRLLRRQGRRPAQGDRQEEPRRDGEAQAGVRRGLPRLGTSPQVTEFLWQTNERSANYSFNKSHAACYALIAYRTAWLKANYTAEYMAALISSVMSTKDKVPFFVARCEEMGIGILPPDVNESDHEFVVVGNDIRFGLDAVKGVGYQAVEAIKRAREEGGRFTSLWDFCARVDCRAVNKKAIEALIKCGAFGSTGATRKGMLAVLEQAQASGSKAQQDAQIGQGSIFDMGDSAPSSSPFLAPSHPSIPAEEATQPELLAMEKESIGLFVSAHPLKRVREALRARTDCSLADLGERRDGDWVTVGGIITETKRIRTKKGDPMMFATLDDLEGSVELLIFGNALAAAEGALAVDKVVVIRGRVDHKDAAKTCVIVQEAQAFEPSAEEVERAHQDAAARPTVPTALRLRVDAARLPATVIDELKHVFEKFPGEAEVVLEMQTAGGPRRLRFGTGYRVAPSASLRADLEHVLGPAALA